MSSTSNLSALHVKIYSPFVTYFNGDALSLSAVNETGPFDILPQHHKLLALLVSSDVVVRLLDGGMKKFSINGGVIHVKDDQATIFLDV